MRTLFEIIEAAKIGDPTTHDECLYALLAYAGLAYFDEAALRRHAFDPPSKFRTPQRDAEESHQRWKMALGKSPKDWLGPNNDPASNECRQRVRLARGVFDKIASQAEGK